MEERRKEEKDSLGYFEGRQKGEMLFLPVLRGRDFLIIDFMYYYA